LKYTRQISIENYVTNESFCSTGKMVVLPLCTPRRRRECVAVQFHTFLNSTPVTGKWSAYCSQPLCPLSQSPWH